MSEAFYAILLAVFFIVACDMGHTCEKEDNAALCSGKYARKFMTEFNKGFQPVERKEK